MKRYNVLVLILLFAVSLWGQKDLLLPDHLQFDPELNYDPSIPSPAEFLGYELGERFTVYARVEAYFQALAGASDRVTLFPYGETYEGRKLYNVVVSSAENQGRLEDLRQRHLQLVAAAETGESAGDIMDTDPVFVSMSYNIHGNEASSTEAAMQVAYRLAAAQDPETQRILDNAVMTLYICINPDGRDRYVYWYNGVARNLPGAHPRDLEHYAPWPNGRTNHYWFDLNRDWVWGVHPESRGHAAEYQRWMPQVHVDYHEQSYNSNYFTMPGTTPRNKLLPDNYEALSDTFGMANVRAFNDNLINYFTRDAFDFFYPGYGSSYPSVMGAIGMLTEQGGITAGRAVETDDGFVLTLRQRIWDHYTTSLATMARAADLRREFLEYSFEAWRPENAKASTRAYYLSADSNPYLQDVVAMLLRQGVKVHQLQEESSISNATDFLTGETVTASIPTGSYVVSADQARHLFIQSVLERQMEIEDSVMYDMATWSAPLAYNLRAFGSTAAVSAAVEEVTEAPVPERGLRNPDAAYAYVIEWRQRHAPRALAYLWDKEYRVRAALDSFKLGERSFGPGSLIVLKGRNRERLENMAEDMAMIADRAGVVIEGFDTGRMEEGWDLASSRNRPVEQPKVALMVEPPFDTYTSGQLYFLFDQETRMSAERIRTSILQQTDMPRFGARYGYADLNDYDVLILPGGGNDLKALFGEKGKPALEAWIRAGGVVVATEDAVPFFTAEESEITNVKLAEMQDDSTETAKFLAYGDRQDYYGKKRIPGSALYGRIDVSHPLAFGLDTTLYSLKFGSDALVPDPDLQTVGYYHPDPGKLLVAGYAAEDNLNHLAGKTFAAVREMGQGKVVFLLDNTQYRMFWRGPSRLMQNAVMLLPAF